MTGQKENQDTADTMSSGMSRRTVLSAAGIGAGIGAGVGAGLLSAAMPAAAQTAMADIWSAEYWATKKTQNGKSVQLNLWRKRIGAPRDGEAARPVVFMVHGSSNSARSSYDLSLPGKGEYSFMNVLARAGYDVWTMDHDGYGYSGSSGNSSDIASGVEDLKAAMPVVTKETGRQKAHFYGTSSGGIRAASFAQAVPDCVDRLALSAFTYKGNGAEEIARRRANLDKLRANPRRKRDAAMIRSIFTRDGFPQGYDPAVAEAIIEQEKPFGDTIPSGTYVDMAANLPLVDPTKIQSPVLMLRGEFDGNSTNDDLLDFYRQLPNGERQFVILPKTAHAVGYGINRHLLFYAVQTFFAAPDPVGA